jgi:cysteinyl-tRNA synthetase
MTISKEIITMAKRKALTSDEINAKKEELKGKVKESIELVKSGVRSSPATDFLEEIKEVVKEALDNGVSYKLLSKNIYDVYAFKVSEQTIRAYAHSVLGVPKRSRNTKKTEVTTEPKTTEKNSALADENELV